MTTRTVENNFDIERFTVTSAMRHSQTPIDSVKSELCVADTFAFSGTAGDTFSLIKEVLIVTSRDVPAHDHPAKVTELGTLYKADYDALRAEQVAAWKARWDLADVIIEGDCCGATRDSFQPIPIVFNLLWRRRAPEHWTERLYW